MIVQDHQPGDAAPSGEEAWRLALKRVITHGAAVSPRGQSTTELLHHTVTLDLARPVVTAPLRRLNYKFMCAEALWILDGDNALAPLTRFVKRMADFSDDGVTLAGAYGPRIVPQLPYIVDTLMRDRETRQAVATIWTPSPAPSRDTPCTVAVVFSIRKDTLHQQVFMRSSDLVLGLCYDMFSFSCWGIYVACAVNKLVGSGATVRLGTLTVIAASSHLYDCDLALVQSVLATSPSAPIVSCPPNLVAVGDWEAIRADLERQREGQPAQHWKVVP